MPHNICPVSVGVYSLSGAYSGPFPYGDSMGDNRLIWKNECFLWIWTSHFDESAPVCLDYFFYVFWKCPTQKEGRWGHIRMYWFQISPMNDSLDPEHAPLQWIYPNHFQFVLTSSLEALNLPHSKTSQMGHSQTIYTGSFFLGPYKWLSPMSGIDGSTRCVFTSQYMKFGNVMDLWDLYHCHKDAYGLRSSTFKITGRWDALYFSDVRVS